MGGVVEVGGVVESDLVVGLIRLAVVDTQDVFGSRFELVATGEWAGPVELEGVFVELQAVVGELVAVADGEVAGDVVVVGLPLLRLVCGREQVRESESLVLAVSEVLIVELAIEIEVAVLWRVVVG